MFESRSDPSKRFWRISRYHHRKDEILAEIQVSHISDRNLVAMMKTLLSRISLTDNEIISYHLTKGRTNKHQEHFIVHWETSKDPISCLVVSGSSTISAQVVMP
tara:strand:- start:1186 stop:1497 length:312 start_codon:yes stop_codon:yes gene_type:complete